MPFSYAWFDGKSPKVLPIEFTASGAGLPFRNLDSIGSMQTENNNLKWTNKTGISERYGISIRSVNNLMRRRVLPHVKIGRNIRFDVQACDEAIKAFEMKAVCPQGGRSSGSHGTTGHQRKALVDTVGSNR
jgi:hypothetical protein